MVTQGLRRLLVAVVGCVCQLLGKGHQGPGQQGVLLQG
jgi:hypothetical protein